MASGKHGRRWPLLAGAWRGGAGEAESLVRLGTARLGAARRFRCNRILTARGQIGKRSGCRQVCARAPIREFLASSRRLARARWGRIFTRIWAKLCAYTRAVSIVSRRRGRRWSLSNLRPPREDLSTLNTQTAARVSASILPSFEWRRRRLPMFTRVFVCMCLQKTLPSAREAFESFGLDGLVATITALRCRARARASRLHPSCSSKLDPIGWRAQKSAPAIIATARPPRSRQVLR